MYASRAAILVLSAAMLSGGRPTAGAPGDRVPLPVDKTRKVQDSHVLYTVEGRVRVPRGVEVTLFSGVKVVAIGKAPAVIEVEGGFDCIGVYQGEVIFEGVTVEPCEKFERIHMDMAIFRTSGGIRTPKDKAVGGYMLLENLDITNDAVLDVTFARGSMELSTVCADKPTNLMAVVPTEGGRDKRRLFIRGCPQDPNAKCTPHGSRVGFVGGLVAEGWDDATIQLSRVGGDLTSIRNWGQRLVFDGMKVNSKKLEIRHDQPGMMSRVQCAKCDIYSPLVSVFAPFDAAVRDVLTMDRCWFKDLEDARSALSKVIQDGEDDPSKNGVRVVLPKVGTRPLQLAGEWEK